MARAYSEIPKFKRIEADVRSIASQLLKLRRSIETIETGRRTVQETRALSTLRESCVDLQRQALDALNKFWDDIEGGSK